MVPPKQLPVRTEGLKMKLLSAVPLGVVATALCVSADSNTITLNTGAQMPFVNLGGTSEVRGRTACPDGVCTCVGAVNALTAGVICV